MATEQYIQVVIVAVLGVVVALALLPTVVSSVAGANLTGTNAAIAGLIVTIFVLGIVYFIYKVFFT